MTDELKPCPFCGKDGLLNEMTLDVERDVVRCAVGCSDLECIGFNAGRDLYDSEEEDLAAWNRRPGCGGCVREWLPASDRGAVCLYCSRNFVDLYEPNGNEKEE